MGSRHTIKAHKSASLKHWRINVVIRLFSATCRMIIGLRLMLGLGTDSVFFLWANIELSILVFLALWATKSPQLRRARIIKVFLIQSLAGLGMLATIIAAEINIGRGFVVTALVGFCLVKLGGFPFQNWVLEIVETLPVEIFFMFLTVQKVLPLHLASFFASRWLLILSTASWAALTLRCMSIVSVKKIVVVSSTYFIIALVRLLPSTGLQWKVVFFVYSLTLAPLFLLLGPGPRRREGQGKPSAGVRCGWALVLGTLAGIPPLPGFFLKLEVLLVFLGHLEWGVRVTFLLRGVLLVRMYMSILIKSFHEASWGALGSPHSWHTLTLLVGGALLLLAIWV